MAAVLAATGKVENLEDLLARASRRIATALGLPPNEARLEARVLAAHALGVNRAWLVAHGLDALSEEHYALIQTVISRRCAGEPVAYIVGEREFYGRFFKVTPDVLIPRPETELLVDAALERLPLDRRLRILDLGTGSGCIAISLALERALADVMAVDASPAAITVAKENARRFGAENVRFSVGSWYAEFGVKKFDMIISNPPYLPGQDAHLGCGDLRFEPHSALASGAHGTDALRAIAEGAAEYLNTDGWLLLEHGYDQRSTCVALLKQAGFGEIFVLDDLAGLPRVCGGRRAVLPTLTTTATVA